MHNIPIKCTCKLSADTFRSSLGAESLLCWYQSILGHCIYVCKNMMLPHIHFHGLGVAESGLRPIANSKKFKKQYW